MEWGLKQHGERPVIVWFRQDLRAADHAALEAAATEVLQEAGVTLGTTHPRPIAGLARGRQRALEAYGATVQEAVV